MNGKALSEILCIIFSSFFVFACSNVNHPAKVPGSKSKVVLNPSTTSQKKAQHKKKGSTCPTFKSGNNRISQNMTLPGGCQYSYVNFILDKSNITFDCNGASLNGLRTANPNILFKEYNKKNKPLGSAFLIKASNITVKNCHIKNYVDGVRIRSHIPAKAVRSLRAGNTAIEDQLRSKAPKDINLIKLDILNSHKHGIFVERYVTGVNINQVRIQHAGNSGIYLESGTQRIKITQSEFTKNGFVDYRKRIRYPKLAKFRREAIAVDSSANNVIANNTFESNGGGGIFLYKNCFEHHKQGGQMPRFQHSDNNLIQANTFINESYGIRVAARQSRNLILFECGDPLIAKVGLFQKYYEDFAKNNQIIDNRFINVSKGVTVEDDNTTLRGNQFSGRSRVNIQIGTPYRTRYKKKPVSGTILKNNQYNSSAKDAVTFIYQRRKG